MRVPLLAAASFALLIVCHSRAPALAAEPAAAADEAGFASIFDGRTLDGWKAPDPAGMAFWHVEDGAITGEVTADRAPRENVFIVWQGDSAGPTAGDFEIRFRFRIFGKEANS